MSLAITKLVSPALHPVRPPAEEALSVFVVFTSIPSTLAALQQAGTMAKSLGAHIKLLVPQVVPYPLPLNSPPCPLESSEKRFRVLAGQCPIRASVHIYLCRDSAAMLNSVLAPGSIVVLGGKVRPFWPTREQKLARQLRKAGMEVLLVDPPTPAGAHA